jgi:integrase
MFVIKETITLAYIEHRGHASYRLVVDAGYGPDGKRIRRTKTIKIEDEALLRTTRKLKNYLNEELTKFKIEVESGEYIAPEKMTFASFVNEWREKYA